MSKIINLLPAGAIKNGARIVSLDYTEGTASIWDLAICKVGGTTVLFSKHSSGATFSPSSLDQIANFIRDNQNSPAVLVLLDALKPYAASATSVAGAVYVTDATETGLYFDGVSKITNAPVTAPTLNDLINKQLGGTGNVGTGAAGSAEPMAVPFYKKPLVWVAAVVVAGIAYFAFKNK